MYRGPAILLNKNIRHMPEIANEISVAAFYTDMSCRGDTSWEADPMSVRDRFRFDNKRLFITVTDMPLSQCGNSNVSLPLTSTTLRS
jgi:hypothetical protein